MSKLNTEWFNNHKTQGICAVCGKETDVITCGCGLCSSSYQYCADCAENEAEPYATMVSVLANNNLHFPKDVDYETADYIRNSLRYQNISEEKFIQDVDKRIIDLEEFYKDIARELFT